MKINHPCRFFIGLFCMFLFSGCATALVAGGAAVGAGAGTYIYVNGELRTAYAVPFDQVWKATEKTIADMRGTEVQPAREIAKGKISARINDEKVSFDIVYKAKSMTSVGVRVGLFGNQRSSQLIHDKIMENLGDN
ncbi:MAG: DUF3568 family protein [Smithellaceae bacterium]